MKINKFITLTALLCVMNAGNALAEESMKLIGAGVLVSTSAYHGIDAKTLVAPLIVWDYKNFYIKGVEAGYHFYDTRALRLSVVTAPRFMGYHSDDSAALNGMADREYSWDAGLSAEISLPWEGAFLDMKIVNDVLSRNRGREAQVKLAKEFKGSFFELTPSAGVRWQSKEMTDYYYGVKANEAQAGREEYVPGSALNYFSGLMFNFGISKDWIVVTKAEVEALSDRIRKSPIVGEDYTVTAVIGLARKF
ncbi:MAG: MipA/OmpV family protein [Candidatus Omnitrophica bacterium]|nr:MipA/OmpV family protein [Candidatus Omnitrophota bacterium]